MTTSPTLKIRVENITPILYVSDMARSLAFYVDVLGFEQAPWGDGQFTSVSKDNGSIYLCKGGQGQPGTWVWIGFDGDLEALHQHLLASGVTIALAPTNFPWAYELHAQDPDGHILRFGTDPQ